MAIPEAEIWTFLADVAPLSLAESWDNVGLLVEGTAAGGERPVDSMLVTVDLTQAVFEEARACEAQAIIAYHPPIFAGLKRLARRDPVQRVLLDAIAAGMSIYSPHTALDATAGGIADWLADGLGPVLERQPITSREEGASVGAGRLISLPEPVRLSDAIAALKQHLSLTYLRVAAPSGDDPMVRTVAVCPGAGGSLFADLGDVDLYLTGEMRHHDVLDKVRVGSAVILTEHTNCERGYLPILAQQIRDRFAGALEVRCATKDRDPLEVR